MVPSDNISSSPSQRFLKASARSLMALLYFAIFGGVIAMLIVLWPEIMTEGRTFDFLGRPQPVYLIAIIVVVILLPISLYGMIIISKMLIHLIKKRDFKVPLLAKAGVVYIFIIAIIGVGTMMPFWYIELGVKTSYGPYIAYHGENGMLISWDTTTPKDSIVNFGTNKDNLDLSATGGENYWQPGGKSLHHAVKLSNLTKGTTYYYTIPGFDSKIYAFKTAPAVNSGKNVTFFMVADTQGGYPTQKAAMKLVANDPYGIDFMCIAGDLNNRNDANSEWAMIMNKNSFGGMAATIPWMNAPGNHETYCSKSGCGYRTNYKMFFQYDYPNNRQVEPGALDYGLYHSYNVSNVHMVALDNFEFEGTILLNSTQLAWLEGDLARNADNWKFLYFHIPMYSLGDFHSYKDLALQLEPILYKYQVDAVFYGHDHHFEAFRVNATESYGGTYHFVVGGGGGSIDPVISVEKYGDRAWPSKSINASTSDGRYNAIYGHEYEIYGEMVHHFMRIHVSGDTATFTAIRTYDGTTMLELAVTR
jgi:3',5'-cyclic AMP phosphodiesterase CpdA